ncbi:transcriptional modulator of MazE/toxin, MazF [Paenibacillus vortex V453]|uniref:mRNA interferase n=1 Tax=Paenibacillus vortex V453 TaxID=715225 RepID=A0A2R9T2W9_9BACL|nr:type II toxin-antitoxin system PemK/MazF family toxin [Paenibacillus vortex]EFU43870.1 transcriptional modulator of MazE/toxin, MazF [Paenibacillus vortex V453]
MGTIIEKSKIELEKRIKRGEIYMCKLPKGPGSVQSNYRPVLIIQNDIGNQFSPTTLIAPISRKNKPLPTHVQLNEGVAGLLYSSFVLCEQIRTVDKSYLTKYIGKLRFDSIEFKEIETSILISLGFN